MSDLVTQWSRWFAWYPVRTLNWNWRWLCRVERRERLVWPHGDPVQEYRDIGQ